MGVQKMLDDIGRGCTGPARGRGGLPEKDFTEKVLVGGIVGSWATSSITSSVCQYGLRQSWRTRTVIVTVLQYHLLRALY